IGCVSIRRHIESLIGVLGIIKIVRDCQEVLGGEVPVESAKRCTVINRVDDRLVFVLAETGLEEVDQREPLAIGTAGDRRIVSPHYGSGNRTRSTDSSTEIVAAQIFEDLLERAEKECLVPDNRSPDASAGLFAAEILKRFAVGGIGGQTFEPLIMEQAPVYIVCPGFGDDVDDTAGRAAKLGTGPGGHDLELPHGFHADVHGGSLPPDLLTEKSIVVVAAIQGNVVENAALAGKVDLVTVRALHDADSGRECQQVLELDRNSTRLNS